ncbi:response regulator transcription factor [Nonomuraea rosea]|uniref:response regulator n=1 Tax=Nonomuraea rosea TaxID=638574 RepID=UPI0031EFE451
MRADESAPIRVLIVDDDALVRAGLTLMLKGAPDLHIVGAVADGGEVEGAVAEHGPDVVLMDIRMNGLDGIEATRRLRARAGAPEVVVLTTFDADELVFRALRAGASGFLLKDTRVLAPKCGHLECRMMEIRRQGVPRGDEVVSAGVQGGRRRVVSV